VVARDNSGVKACEGEGKAKEEGRRRADWTGFGPPAGHCCHHPAGWPAAAAAGGDLGEGLMRRGKIAPVSPGGDAEGRGEK
jgi:hypothetical protein